MASKSKAEELKKLNAEKKALNEKQKALRDELNATKAERAEARKVQAAARKVVREQKAALRDLSATIYAAFSEGDSDKIETLADSIVESAAELAASVRNFGESIASVDDL